MSNANWTIDPLHSAIGFSVRHLIVARVRGKFNKWTAELQLDDQDVTRSTVSVRIDAASIDTGVAQRDDHLRSPDFFDVASFPELVFASKRVVRDGEELKVTGDLTIRGTTKEVVLRVENAGQVKDPWGGTRAGFTARTSIDRKAFGLTWNQLLEAGGVAVGDKVEIELEIEAVKQAAAEKAA